MSKGLCVSCGVEDWPTWTFSNGNWYCGVCRQASINYYAYDGTKSFMRDDKHWHTDIKSRKMLNNGKVGRFKPNGERYG